MQHSILFADDDVIWWKDILFSDALCSDRFRLETAATGDLGLEAALAKDFDLVILDIFFEDGVWDGFSVLSKIKAIKPELKVLMFSSMDDSKTRALCKRLGATTFISKNTVTDKELKRVIDSLLSA